MKIKRIISLILAFCITVGNIQGYALELDDACPGEMSSDSHIGCSFMKGKELLTKGNDYVGIKNVGKDSEYSFYFFSYRAINEILDKFKLCSKKEMEEKFPMKMERVLVEPSGALKALALCAGGALGSIIGIGIGAVLVFLFDVRNGLPCPSSKAKSSGKAFSDFKEKVKHIASLIKEKLYKNKFIITLCGLSGGIAGGLWGSKLDLKGHYECVYSENFSENLATHKKIENNNTIILSALNSLEEGISDKDYQTGENDFIFLRLTHSKDYPIGYAEFNKAGIKYSDEEKASFAPKFEELRNNLTEILKNKKEYGVY